MLFQTLTPAPNLTNKKSNHEKQNSYPPTPLPTILDEKLDSKYKMSPEKSQDTVTGVMLDEKVTLTEPDTNLILNDKLVLMEEPESIERPETINGSTINDSPVFPPSNLIANQTHESNTSQQLNPTTQLNEPNKRDTIISKSSELRQRDSYLDIITMESTATAASFQFEPIPKIASLAKPISSTPVLPKPTKSPSFLNPKNGSIVSNQPKNSPQRQISSGGMARYGTKVGEGHNNYALMYNMLTGIRVSVSRCQAKLKRPLAREDFSAANKLAFDITGNELTPSSKYDFKFKDYSPWVFRSIRELFLVDPAEYLLSLTLKYMLSELGTPGKSGSFFYYSSDFRFIIKTISHTEHKFFRKVLPSYYDHVKREPDTLICRLFGLHRVKLPHTRKIHFIVMANVLPPTKDIHQMFDLKGSTQGRLLNDDQIKDSKMPKVLKDLNWLNSDKNIELGPIKRNELFRQLKSDVDFLARNNIMDYSLLLGIHNMQRGNKDKLRQATLTVFDPSHSISPNLNVKPTPLQRHQLPESIPEDRLACKFYKDDGGYLSTNEQDLPSTELYCMGIIDIMTPYNTRKKFEHFFKSLAKDPDDISCVDPVTYAHRFLAFLTDAIKFHDDLKPQLDEYAASHRSKYHNKHE